MKVLGCARGALGWAAALAALVSWAPAPAQAGDAGGVVIRPFEGRGAARVRAAVVAALKDQVELVPSDDAEAEAERLGLSLASVEGRAAVSRELGVRAWVVGRVQKRGRVYEAEIELLDARDGSSLALTGYEGRNPRVLARDIDHGFLGLAREAIARGGVPQPRAAEPQRETEPAAAPRAEQEPELAAAGDGARELPEEDEPSAGRPPPFDAELALVGFSRSFEYNDDLSGLRTYSLGMGPALAFAVRYYPVAHLDDGPLANLGLELGGRFAFAIDSAIGDTSFPTSANALHAGLRGRLPLGQHELSLFGGYATQRFAIEDVRSQGLRVEPGVPTTQLSMLRAGAALHVALGDAWALGASAAYLFVLSSGELEDWFPHNDGAQGAELELGLEHGFSRALSLRLSFGLTRVVYAFAPTAEDARAGLPVAGGASDQSLFGGLGMRFVLGGGE